MRYTNADPDPQPHFLFPRDEKKVLTSLKLPIRFYLISIVLKFVVSIPKNQNRRPHSSKVLKELRCVSLDDFRCAKNFPDFLAKIYVDFFVKLFVGFCILTHSAAVISIHQTCMENWWLCQIQSMIIPRMLSTVYAEWRFLARWVK